jgi:hypothetical protein
MWLLDGEPLRNTPTSVCTRRRHHHHHHHHQHLKVLSLLAPLVREHEASLRIMSNYLFEQVTSLLQNTLS